MAQNFGICFGCEIEFLSDAEIISEDKNANIYCIDCTNDIWIEFERKRKEKQKQNGKRSKPNICYR
jgi:hypothetical protein